jgi:predicted MPP superfamily phosphohydrolase
VKTPRRETGRWAELLLARSVNFRKAQVRHLVLTVAADRISGGRLLKRHLAQETVVRRVEVRHPDWPAAFDGLRIAHVSDFHLGRLMPVERAVAIVGRVGELSPDLIACTGDVVDLHHDGAAAVFAAMAACGAPLGAFLVLGNHDHLDSDRAIARLAARAGVATLRDEAVALAARGAALRVAGVNWARSIAACDRRVRHAAPAGCDLLLSHNPKSFRAAARLGVPLTLAGHTHGGQVAVPRRPRTNLAFSHRLNSGLYRERDSFLYVTAGLGAWFPLRINCPPEIALLTVRRGEAAAELSV